MKKNKMMRTASGLLVATLLTTSVISGTFAKYTTTDSARDTARVAKWGVTAVVSGDLFGADYVEGSASDTEGIISASYTGSVDSDKGVDGEKIVAPGTKAGDGVKITISGTPEVKNTVKFSSTSNENKDIYLTDGTYGTMVAVDGITADNFVEEAYYKEPVDGKYEVATNANEAKYELHDKVTLVEKYYPIQWTVTGTGGNTYNNVSDMVGALSRAFDSTNKSLDVIDKNYTIKWAWAFSTDSTADGADTILGNIIAANTSAVPVKLESDTAYRTLTETTDYCTTVAFNYSITVTQVD